MRLLPLCLLFACQPDDDDENGSLTVTWSVGPDGCAAAGVDEVAVVWDGATLATAPCDDGGTTIDGVVPGSGTFMLRGRDAARVDRFGSEAMQLTVDPGEDVTLEEQRLTALPARLEVSWYFANGRLCAANEAERIEVDVWDDGYLAADPVAACDDGLLLIQQLPSGAYDVSVRAVDDDGVERFAGATSVELEKGDAAEIEVPLDAM